MAATGGCIHHLLGLIKGPVEQVAGEKQKQEIYVEAHNLSVSKWPDFT